MSHLYSIVRGIQTVYLLYIVKYSVKVLVAGSSNYLLSAKSQILVIFPQLNVFLVYFLILEGKEFTFILPVYFHRTQRSAIIISDRPLCSCHFLAQCPYCASSKNIKNTRLCAHQRLVVAVGFGKVSVALLVNCYCEAGETI